MGDLFYVGPMIANKLFVGDGKGHFTDGSAAAGLDHSGTAQGMNIADVDGDGDLDIFVSQIGISACNLYENDGKGHFKDGAYSAGVDYHTIFGQGVAFGDLDGDGDLDMYLENYGLLLSKDNKLLMNQASTKAWLKVRPLAQNGHATLFGAEVRLYEAGTSTPAAARTQIDGGSAFASQNAYDAYFGLSSSSAKTFDIELRCGGAWITKATMPELGGVAPNQIVKVKCTNGELGGLAPGHLVIA